MLHDFFFISHNKSTFISSLHLHDLKDIVLITVFYTSFRSPDFASGKRR